jgi:hypothetical protein
MKRFLLLLLILIGYTFNASAQQKTYCNPINIDYGFTPITIFSENGRHRATAVPVIVVFKNNYYLFQQTNGGIGYPICH